MKRSSLSLKNCFRLSKQTRPPHYGAPDLIVEVLSPHTSLKDKREKKKLYERFGVLEYIIVHPEEMLVERYYLQENKYTEPDIFVPEEIIPIYFTEGIKIPLWEIFEIAPPENIENEYRENF